MTYYIVDILAGDYKRVAVGQGVFTSTVWVKAKPKGRSKVKLKLRDWLERVEAQAAGPASSGSVLGGAVVGELIAGPVGAVVGGMMGSRKGRTVFRAFLKDGSVLLLAAKPRMFEWFLAADHENRFAGSPPRTGAP